MRSRLLEKELTNSWAEALKVLQEPDAWRDPERSITSRTFTFLRVGCPTAVRCTELKPRMRMNQVGESTAPKTLMMAVAGGAAGQVMVGSFTGVTPIQLPGKLAW